MEDLVHIQPTAASPTEVEKFLNIPESYTGRRIYTIAFDETGLEIGFEDHTRLIVEDHWGAHDLECEEEDLFYYVGAFFYGIDVREYDVAEDVVVTKLVVKTSFGSFDIQSYDATDIRAVEFFPS